MTIEKIQEGPPVDYRKKVSESIRTELEIQLDDTNYPFIPRRKNRELLRRWLFYYYATEVTKNDSPMDVLPNNYDLSAGASAVLKMLAMQRKLGLKFSGFVSSVVFLIVFALMDIIGIAYGSKEVFPLFLSLFFIGGVTIFISMRCRELMNNKLTDNKDTFFWTSIVLLLFILTGTMIGISLFM